jgi:glycosyltransferase involved in cell wall biosynthesis
MRKVLFLIEALSTGGAERQTLFLLNSIDKSRFQVYLITWQNKNFYNENDLKGVTWVKFSRSSKFDYKLVLNIRRFVKNEKIDLVYGILNSGNLYSFLVTVFSNIKFIASERSSERKLPIRVFVHKFFCHITADFNIANSQGGKAFLTKYGVRPDKVEVISNFQDLTKFKSIDFKQKDFFKSKLGFNNCKLIICVARLTPLKNQFGIINAFSKFDFVDEAKICFIGTSEFNYKSKLVERANELNIEEKIIFLDPLHNIEEYYWAADVSVLFSNFEGSPNTPIESIACGTPVITSNVGDVSNYIKKNETGWIVNLQNELDLTNSLNNFFSLSKDVLKRISYNCSNSQVIKQSDPQKLTKKFELIFENI